MNNRSVDKKTNYAPWVAIVLSILVSMVSTTWALSQHYATNEYEKRQDLTDAKIAQIQSDIQELKKQKDLDNLKQDEANYRFQQEVKATLLRMEDKIEKTYTLQTELHKRTKYV